MPFYYSFQNAQNLTAVKQLQLNDLALNLVSPFESHAKAFQRLDVLCVNDSPIV